MTRTLRRLSAMSTEEIRFRTVEKARTAVEAIRYGLGLETWGQAGRACDRLNHFLIDPDRRPEIAAAVQAEFPEALSDAVARAERIIEGRYDLLGYRDLSFRAGGERIDWHRDPVHDRRAPMTFWTRVPYLDPRSGDHKIIWELNRHQHWLALGRAAWLTGDRRYADAFDLELRSWLSANPPLAGVNWASMLELALRSISWIWALHFFAPFEEKADPAWSGRLVAGLERQLEHVARHLSLYFSPNTHLLGEGLALYVAGRALPSLEASARWETLGRRVLLRQAHAQINRDGGHAELSTHYHRYAVDFYLFALAVARRTEDRDALLFEETASRLASFCRAMADDAGTLPVIGDDDGGQLFPICGRPPSDAGASLSLAASLLGRPELAVGKPAEEVLWMLGGDRGRLVNPGRAAAPGSHVFPYTGYAVLRDRDGHAIVDAGRHGFLNGGHAHADALSLVLSVRGYPLLIDPGTATYTMDPAVRDRFRSTPMHNTATIDGRTQSEPAGPFSWRTRADARLESWRDLGVDYLEASHDGYAPIVHRRALVRAGGGLWIVADHLIGVGRHRMDLHWHLDPAWRADPRSAGAPSARGFTREGELLRAALAFSAPEVEEFFGDEGGLGWCAPVYGRLVPSVTLRSRTTAAAPFSILTAIAAAPAPVRLSIDLLPSTAGEDPGWHHVAASVRFNEREIVVRFATPLSGSRGRREPAAARGVEPACGMDDRRQRVDIQELTADDLHARAGE